MGVRLNVRHNLTNQANIYTPLAGRKTGISWQVMQNQPRQLALTSQKIVFMKTIVLLLLTMPVIAACQQTKS